MHQIRLEIKYFKDHYEFRFMAPDRRKRNRKDYGKLVKWEWAIGSGVGGLGNAESAIPDALKSYIQYCVRAIKSNFKLGRSAAGL